jgi:hypothetical protein
LDAIKPWPINRVDRYFKRNAHVNTLREIIWQGFASNKGSTPPSEDSASPSEGADGADGTEEDTGEPDPEIQELRLTHDDAKPWVSETYEHVSEGEAELLEDGTLAGTVAFNLRVDGDVACAMEVALDGIPWEGDCIDCDFAFSIDATLLSGEDRSVCADRFLSTFEDLPTDEYDGPPVLAFWDSYEPRDIPYTWTDPETGEEITKVIEGGPPVSNVLRAGWLSPLYDGTDDKKFVWHTVAADDSELEGNRATVDLATGISQLFAEGKAETQGRVRGVFYPKKQGQ